MVKLTYTTEEGQKLYGYSVRDLERVVESQERLITWLKIQSLLGYLLWIIIFVNILR